jgi:hypothetical protein
MAIANVALIDTFEDWQQIINQTVFTVNSLNLIPGIANAAWDTANAAYSQANTSGNPFDQDLNTSNNVTFNEVTSNNVYFDNLNLTGNVFSSSACSAINFVANSSGDGEGYSTIELRPDTNLSANDQYLIIDPTQPQHIHIRAGGTQDDSNADLFLGGENSYFLVYAGLDSAVEIAANNNTWYFDVDGTLRFPDFSTQTTAFTLTPTLDSLTVNGSSNLAKVVEPFSDIADATGVVTHDCTNNHIFYHTSLDANFTANFTNLSLANGEATSLTLVLSQGGTAYIANNVQIAGEAQTIKWSANTVPTGNTNAVDVQSFSVLRVSGNYIVLGQLSTFG